LPALGFKLADTLLLNSQRLAYTWLAELLGINLSQPASHRRLAQLHVSADLLHSDHFNDLQFEARVEDSSF